MQLFEVNKQLEAISRLAALVEQHSQDSEIMRVFLRAREEWPEDFDMQVFEVEKQIDARNALRSL